MSRIEVLYDIIFDENSKKSYKSLKFLFKNTYNQVQDVSSVFIIKPDRNYREQNLFDFTSGYDLSFSDISSVEFTDRDFENKRLIPGVWKVGYSDTNSISNITNIKTVYVPYRDFLYNNSFPLMARDDNNLDTLFLTISREELFNLKRHFENNFFSMGKSNLEDLDTFLRLFLDIQTWLPEKEETINNTGNSWKLPDNYIGPTDGRLHSTPTYYTDETGTIRLYKDLNDFNEPGLDYNSSSINKKNYFVNKVANIEYINTTFTNDSVNPIEKYNTLYEQYHKIQYNNLRNSFSNIEIKSFQVGVNNIDNWELELYIPEGAVLENKDISENIGYFSYSEDGTDTKFLMGIRGVGTDSITDGSSNFICVDKNGVYHKALLADYGVGMNGSNYIGGFSIKYRIRKNSDNLHDIYIFIKDQFVMKIKDGGIPMNNLNNWGLPTNYDNDLMISNSCVSMLYETVEMTCIDDIYNKNNVRVTWKKSKRIVTRSEYLDYDSNKITIPISNSVITNNTKQIFNYTGNSGGHIYPVSMKETNSDLATSDISDNYIFYSGINNKFYIDVNDFNCYFLTDTITKDNSNNRLSIEITNQSTGTGIPINWEKPEIEWMHNETIEQNLISDSYHDISLNKASFEYTIENEPVLFKNELNLDYSKNEIGGDTWEYIFDAGEERQIVLEISGGEIDFEANQTGFTASEILEQNKLFLEIADTSDNWITPEVDWLYKNISTIDTVGEIFHPKVEGASDWFNYSYDISNVEYNPLMYYDSEGGQGRYLPEQDTENHSPDGSTTVLQIFVTDPGKTISLEIQDFQFENNYDFFKIEGCNSNNPNPLADAYEPINNYWMKNNRNYYAPNAEFGGNFFPPDIYISKLLIYGDGNDPRHIYLNLPYSRVKFSFFSSPNVEKRGWKMKVFSTDEKYLINGNIFPQQINVNKLIQTNKRFIKLKYRGAGNYSDQDLGFRFKIHSYSDLENKYGNFFPRTPSDAIKMANVEHFEDINRIVLDCSYVKINYRQEDIDNNTKFDIVIDNKNDTYYDISLNSDVSGQIFSETIFKKSYPVKFFQGVDISAGEYSYTFDSGENNSIQLLISDFSFNHIEDISGIITDISQSIMSFSLSKNNIDWVPLSVSWMHKSNYYYGNSFGGSIPNGSSWLNDTNGFILPKNKEKALCMDLSLNPQDIVYSDLSFNKVNKIRTEYRYLKIIYNSLISQDNSSWDIKIFIKENKGINDGFLSNKNNIQLITNENQISSFVQEIKSSELNLSTFKDSNECIKNKQVIPYITKYNYELRDISNNIHLKSQIDTDILYENIENNIYNYNGKRTGKELKFLKDIITSNDIQYEIRQKYNYNVKVFNNKNQLTTPYIPGMAEKKFFAAAKTVRLTIPNEQVVKLRENLITHWNADDVPTYVDYIFYVWNPFTNKAEIVLSNTNDNVISDLSRNLNVSGVDQIFEIKTDSKTYFDRNIVAMPDTTSLEYTLTEFTGVYIFSWSYKVFQPTGSYNSVSPSDFQIYEPSCNIINLADYLKDDFIYDTLAPIFNYTSYEENQLLGNNFDLISLNLSEQDKTNFNLFSKKYKKNLLSEGYDISSVKIYFYIWTPNNEISNQGGGWTLPNDYYGVTDPRITQTPYMFETLPYGVSEYIWDPFFSVNQQTELGYNIDASGTIFKEYEIQKNNIDEFLIEGANDIVIDISSSAIPNYGTIISLDVSGGDLSDADISGADNIQDSDDIGGGDAGDAGDAGSDISGSDISGGDISGSDVSQNNTIIEISNLLPNPYDYSKNQIFGIPYLARWGYTIYTTKPIDINDQTKGYINIESRVQKQTGTLGNPDTDFNFKFKFNKDYYLELDKNTLAEYQGTTEFKDFKNTGLTLGFIKGNTYLISKINDLFWQVVIERPPVNYIFDYLDENGNVLGQTNSVTSNNDVDLSGVNLKYEGDLETTLNLDSVNLSFEEKILASIDAGRKYKLFIRKATDKEKIYFSNFVDSTMIQFENNDITTRLSDWYPLNVNYVNTSNQYRYGVLSKTQEIVIEQKEEEEVRIDPCGLCRPITKTKNAENLNLRYARNVGLNFRSAGRLREAC